MSAAQKLKARLAAKKAKDQAKDQNEEVRPFSEVQQEIEAQFVDLELKAITILTFDFDYDFGTPFVFIKLFLNTHYDHMKLTDPKEF